MNRLKEVRFHKRVSQYRLAQLANVHQPRISLIENELITPREEEIQKLSKALQVKPEEIWENGKN